MCEDKSEHNLEYVLVGVGEVNEHVSSVCMCAWVREKMSV